MSEKGNMGNFGSELHNRLPSSESQLLHIFRDSNGHLTDTAKNRQLLLELINNEENYCGKDSYGLEGYSLTLSNGMQLWATVRNGILQNGGINTEPRLWDSTFGFNRVPSRKR